MTNAVFSFALWLCKCTTQIQKNETKKLLNLKRLYIHLKRILYRFIYVHIMYMFSCWWYDRQCLDIFPSCLLHLAVLEKKRDTCLINASYAHHRFYFWYFSLMFIFKLTRCFKYAVKTESESNPRWVLFFCFFATVQLEHVTIFNLHIAKHIFEHLQGLKKKICHSPSLTGCETTCVGLL